MPDCRREIKANKAVRGKRKPASGGRSVAEFIPYGLEHTHDKGKEWKDKERYNAGSGEAFHDYPPRATVFLTAFPSLPALLARSHPFIFTHSPFPWALSCLSASRVFLATFYFVTWRRVYARKKPHMCVRNPLTSYTW